VLRRGAEAEPFADDLRHVWTVEHDLAEILVDGVLRRWPNLRPIETPRDPIAGGPVLDDVTVFEWLDRPLPHAESSPNRFSQVLATLFRTPGRLKLSSPDPSAFARLDEPPFREAAILLREARREATPLPLAWSDAALGAFRFPKGLDDASQRVLTRDAIERYFEHLWIHQPRRALDGLTPLEASRGDTEARAKLAGVLRFREQLGTRSTHAPLYQGYPFDRLRRRLGLIRAEESGVVDPDDLSCMSGEELDALDFAKSTPPRQAEALASAASLRDDDRTARFLTAWLKADPSRFGALDLELMVAPLIRRALEHDDVSEAIAVLRKVADLASDPSSRRVAETWAGEILARFGQPFEAIEHFMAVVAELPPEEAATAALDAAETLLDNGLEFKAEGMLKEALLRATELGMDLIAAEAREHLARLG
jgi:tetratricopeptide (TPR) repeat protein